MGKMAQLPQISNFKNSKLPESYATFQNVVKNIEGFFFPYFHIYYVAKFGKIIFWMIVTSAKSQNP